MKRSAVPLVDVTARAAAQVDAAAQSVPRDSTAELRIAHDEWCVSQRPPGTMCDCEPDVSLVVHHPSEGVGWLCQVIDDERRRKGIRS